jgi:hypothetical protein
MDLDETQGKHRIARSAQQFFEKYDLDGNAQLDFSELKNAFKKMGLQVSDQELTGIINQYDQDSDGTIGLPEFKDMAQSAWLVGQLFTNDVPSDGPGFNKNGKGFNILVKEKVGEKEEEEALKEVVRIGGHIVIISMGSELSQILAIVQQLRTPCLPEALLDIPIVILDDTDLDPNLAIQVEGLQHLRRMLAKLDSVFYVQGSALKLDTLVRIGADQCSKILIKSGY